MKNITERSDQDSCRKKEHLGSKMTDIHIENPITPNKERKRCSKNSKIMGEGVHHEVSLTERSCYSLLKREFIIIIYYSQLIANACYAGEGSNS
jgi:hypothetical protein